MSNKSSHHRFPTCLTTGLVRYGERADAREVLEHAAHVRARAARDAVSTRRQERRSFRCPACRGWHLTTQPLRNRPTAA